MNPIHTLQPSGRQEELRYDFYPHHLFVEAVVSLFVLLAVVSISFLWQVPLEDMADPSDTSYVPRPEWYFLFLFQLLKYFEGSLAVVGIVIVPTIVLAALVALPFLDKGDATGLRKRPKVVAAGILGVFSVVVLTGLALVEDVRHAPAKMDLPPITEMQVAEGKRLFETFCLQCHQMNGKGGFMAGDLSQIGARRSRANIEQIILEPTTVSQTSMMSVIPLSDDERHAVSAYLSQKKK
ncbi:c-type cytochrome [Sporomusa acidovorans]|uniref:Uncharacterized protein n=1 Tax=Sporomusa acidovorans (strain ATCC 49682 / DSM 3132 / Mol) TaxID=1123286 RepID=A0ABZ3JAW6_SPOA4|nr:c-type cytochrome [Sporomusa acidovorans]OZC21776.1 cytochrome c [Sporomusa acidovorans DSM 3132]SDD57136.1 menaquinol-cytochrome c reductase cytochrome b/c subunit [Sporomusa acidovorans]